MRAAEFADLAAFWAAAAVALAVAAVEILALTR